jgi:hypothetical protein
MKRLSILLIILSVLIAPPLYAQVCRGSHAGVIGGAASPCTGANPADCTVRETFDGATACGDGSHTNCSNTWTSVTGWCDFDAGSAPQGTYQASCGGASIVNRLAFTAGAQYYATARVTASDVTNITQWLSLKDNSGNNLCYLYFAATGKLSLANTGGTAATGSATYSNGTSYYVKLRAKKGTGANAECQFWTSTNGTAWTTDTASSTNGTWTADVARVYMQAAAAQTVTYDDIRVYTGDISY